MTRDLDHQSRQPFCLRTVMKSVLGALTTRSNRRMLKLMIVIAAIVLAPAVVSSDTTITTHDGRTFNLPIEPSDIVAIEPIRGTAPRLPPPSTFKPGLSIKRGEDGKPTSNVAPNLLVPETQRKSRINATAENTASGPSEDRQKNSPNAAEKSNFRTGAGKSSDVTSGRQVNDVQELTSQPGVVFPLQPGESVPSLAELAAEIPRGGWLLVPAPISTVLYKRKDLNGTTWGKSGSRAVVSAWSGWAWDGNCAFMHNGGHGDYGGNEVYRFCFGDGWERVIETYILPDRTPEVPCPQPSAEEHGPPSSHTYDAIIWSPKTQSIFYFNNGGFCIGRPPSNLPANKPSTNAASPVWEFKDKKWIRRAELDFPVRGRGRTALDANGNIVVETRDEIRVLDPILGKYIHVQKSRGGGFGSMIYVPDLQRFFIVDHGGLKILDEEAYTLRRAVRNSPDSSLAYTSGMAWHGPSGQLVFWNGGREVRLYDPVAGSWKILKNPHGPAPGGKRPLAKWVYSPKYDVFVGLSDHKDGIWLYRLPSSN